MVEQGVTMSSSRWRKRPPDDIGYWLRINVVDKPVITFAVCIDGVLNVMWGANEGSGFLKADHPKLKGWWWKQLNLPKGMTKPDVVWEY